MINFKQELGNFTPINLKDLAEDGISDNEKSSVTLYNKALDSLKNDSEDIAVIELKKALSINPNFPEATNLLGLCYLYMKDYTKASGMFEKVAAMESSGVKAMKYINLLNSSEASAAPATGKKKAALSKSEGRSVSSASDSSIYDIINFKGNWKKDGLKYFIGIVVGALIVFAVYIVFLSDKPDARSASNDVGSDAVSDTDASYESKYNSLEKDYKKLQTDLQAANNEISYYKNAAKLNEVENLVSQRNYEAAADMLALLKTVKFSGTEKNRFDELYGSVMENALRRVMNDGVNLFSAKKYQEAIQKLNKIPVYNEKWESIDRTYYYIGKSYYALNDTKNATLAFQKVVDNYQGSKYATYSQNYLDQLSH